MRLAVAVSLLFFTGCAQILGLDDPTVGNTRPDAAPMADATPTFILTVDPGGTGGGVVTSNGGGIRCPGTCSAVFKQGTSVLLSAEVNGGSTLKGWSDPTCMGLGCRVTVNAETHVGVTFDDNSGGHNFAFVTDGNFLPTAFNPLSAADGICNSEAQKARLPGSYVAWLSTSVVRAPARLGNARGWVRPDGRPIGDRMSDILAGTMYYPIAITASGGDGGMFPPVLTGTNASGNAASTCSDYSSASDMQMGLVGSSGETTGGWTSGGPYACNNDFFHLFCFGVDKDKPVDKPTATGRTVFLRNQPVTLSAQMIMTADQDCAKDARDAGLGGTYKALIAAPGVTAAARFTADARPFVRVDGAVVTAPGQSILQGGSLLSPINVTAAGQYTNNGAVISGASAPNAIGSNPTTCEGWTASGGRLQLGAITNINVWFANGNTVFCAATMFYAIYCVEE